MICLAQFGSEDMPRHYHSELLAIAAAREILFPRATREQLRPRFSSGELSVAQIARSARIPAETVRSVMSDMWKEIVDPIYDAIETEASSPPLPRSDNPAIDS